MSNFALSRLRVLELYINAPHWRLTILAHLVASFLSLATIVAYGFVIGWRIQGSSVSGWEWGNLWLESLAFVPPVTSMLWAFFTIPHLIMTTHSVHPGFDFAIELIVVVVNIVPIAFAFSAYGPMQWMADGSNPTSSGTYAGRWEIVGLLGLVLLEFLNFLLFLWAWRRLYSSGSDGSLKSQGKVLPDDRESTSMDIGRDSIWLPSCDVKSVDSKSSSSSTVIETVRPVYIIKTPVADTRPPPSVEKTFYSAESPVVQTVPTTPHYSNSPRVTSFPRTDKPQISEPSPHSASPQGSEWDSVPDLEQGTVLGEDPELPPPLKVRGSVQKKLHKQGDKWKIIDSVKEGGQGW